ncbi:PaaI family thioesterase [Kordiimonas sp.]|uniref:PaaI family thioesterase n=1 Tax=Kordiimonas sp. TaxID=1970157 RepID=UPI003A8DD2A7
MQQTVTIASRFKGPPTSGNGGYTCGLLASLIDGPAEASLKAPPPLDVDLVLSRSGDGSVLMQGDAVLGVAKPATLDLEVPALPTPLTLGVNPVDAPGRPKKFEPFETCFVCGHERTHPDGLCIHARVVEGVPGMVAAKWLLDENYAAADGNVSDVMLWAALDCPGYFACAAGEAALLARLTAQIIKPLKAEGDATVIGWDMGASGRKRRCGTAVFDADGTLVAKAEGLWVVVDAARVQAGA